MGQNTFFDSEMLTLKGWPHQNRQRQPSLIAQTRNAKFLLQNNQVKRQMHFGHPFIPPPLLCYYVYPPSPYVPIPQYNFCNFSSEEHQQADNPEERENLIVVNEEDLVGEGYEQTKKAWTEEEDQLLLQLCSRPNILFQEVALQLPGRNSKMCYSRYRRITNKSKQYWTKLQNEKLSSLVEQQGENWKQFVQHFPGRNFKQLKDHYENFLNPNLDGKEWTVEEELKLIDLINEHGQKWKVLQNLMPNRSCSQLKNRFFGRIKRLNQRKLAMRKLGSLASLPSPTTEQTI